MIKEATLLARVSTEEQESNTAQTNRLKTFAGNKGFNDFDIFEIEESSSKANREKLQQIIDKIHKSKVTIHLFVDTIDRLQRSFRESVVFDDLRKEGKVEVYFYRENLHLHKNSNSSDLIRWDMGVMFARSYVLQLSDNVKRRFEEKRRAGEWTGTVPFGYVSVMIDEKKRLRSDIVTNPLTADYVKQIFEMYLSGKHSVSTIRNYLNEEGVKTTKGMIFSTSSVHAILSNTFYYGKAYSRKYDTYYDHRYQPLIDKQSFDAVQALKSTRNQNPTHKARKAPNPFADILKCEICGCSICREVKRGKAYHACSNAKKAHKREYTQEATLLEQVKPIFEGLVLSDKQINQIVEYLRENHEYKAKYHKEQLADLNKKYDEIQIKKDRLLDLLIDGRITQPEYDKKLESFNDAQQNINLDRTDHTQADLKYHITAKQTLELARRAGELFERANDAEKNELLKLVLSNATFDGRKLVFSIRKPFDTISNVKGFPVLLRRQDSNLRPID